MTFLSVILIAFLMGISYYLYRKNIINKNLFTITSIFIGIYSLITILIYYNNINSGFKYGILFGDVAGSYFCDEERYFFESAFLSEHLKNGELLDLLKGSFPAYEYITGADIPGFGYKNIFVIFLALLRFVGINSVVDLILIKLIAYIPTSIYLYKLARIYLDEKKSLITVSIFSLLPGYILTNTILMRDNIILMLLIIILYYSLKKPLNYKKLLLFLLLIFPIRGYLPLILPVVLIFCYKNDKKIITIKDILYFLIIILTLLFFSNFKFNNGELMFLGFNDGQMSNLQIALKNLYGSGITFVINIFVQTFIHIVVDPIFPEFLKSGSLYLILFSLGNIVGTILTIVFAIKLLISIFVNKNNSLTYLFKFSIYFTLLCGLLVLCKDSFIINRVALMLLPLYIIILLLPINFKFRKTLNKKQLHKS